MGYYIDLSKITLQHYTEKLKSGYLPPSRKILLYKMETNFQVIKESGIKNVAELRNALKTKKKLEAYSLKSKLSKDYLTILIREINSSIPKPNRLKDFPGISNEVVKKLEEIGIKNTFHLYQKYSTVSERKKFVKETGIDEEILLKLLKLTDLSRVRWVNHTFAFMLYESGYRTVQELADADDTDLYQAIVKINREKKFFKGNIGFNDIKICIQAANEIPRDIEY